MERKKKNFGIMYSAGNSKYKNKNSECDVFTFLPEERTDILKKLKNINFDNEKLKDNYKSINWFDFECITVLLKNEDIMGFSSVWHRDKYYKKGEVRVLNRYWEHPSLRMPGIEIARPHLISSITHQLIFAKKKGYTSAFISRERNYRFMKKLLNEIEKKTDTKWSLSDKKVCVCKKDNLSCWQYKGETKL